jgi:hypothetical protein
MGADGRIVGVDPYSTTWVRAADRDDCNGTVMVVSALDQTSHAVVGLDQRGALLFLRQVLEAAGVDRLVGAARNVVKAYKRAGYMYEDAADDAALDTLAAELAKLEGGA